MNLNKDGGRSGGRVELLDVPIPQEAALDREIGLRGTLRDFVEIAWPIVEPGTEFVNSWHIGLMCEHWQAWYEGEIDRLVINIPPGCSKSILACVFLPTWVWIRNPGYRWAFASFDIDLTTRDAGKSMDLMHDEWFQTRWGDLVKIPKDPPVRNIPTNKGGWRFATSLPDGKITGRHPDASIIDDPTKPNDTSKLSLQKAIDWEKNTLGSRGRDLKNVKRAAIMQRVHEMDLSAYLVEEQGYTHLRLPMRYEESSPCTTTIGKDPRTKNGELLCPDRFDEDTFSRMERDMGAQVIAAQYQQRPVAEGGGIFQLAWFQYYKDLPKRFDQMLMSWDCAFKGDESSDPVVGQVWGRKGDNYYLVDQVRGRMTFTETLEAIRRQANRFPNAVEKLIEDKANGSAVIDTLGKEMSRIVPVKPEGGKESRAHAISHLLEKGHVFFPEGVRWLPELVQELTVFPNGRNDDQVDSMTQALLYMHKERSKLAMAMAKLRDQGFFKR